VYVITVSSVRGSYQFPYLKALVVNFGQTMTLEAEKKPPPFFIPLNHWEGKAVVRADMTNV